MGHRIGTVYTRGSNKVRDSVWSLEVDIKHLKKAEEHIGRNIKSITIKMRSIVRIFVIKIVDQVK